MPKAKFSPTTRGVYPHDVYASFPPDAVQIPDDLYLAFRNGEISTFTVVDGAVVELTPALPTLADLKAAKNSEINAACQSAIYSGFESAALGSAHIYPAKNLDQQNLSASVLSSLMPGLASTWTTPFWCADAGVWGFRAHTAAQIQRAGQDGKAAILAALEKNKTLADQVAAATTAAQVAAIVW